MDYHDVNNGETYDLRYSGNITTTVPWPLTYDGRAVCCAGQQVVHDEQKDGVAQDEGHLEGGAVYAVGRQVEGQDVDEHEEGAGDEQVDHVEDWTPLDDHLVWKTGMFTLNASLWMCKKYNVYYQLLR